MSEVWKVINEFPDYSVSNLGRVKSHKLTEPRVIHQTILPKGYHKVSLYQNNKQHSRYVHRLVAEHFIEGFTDSNNEVNHIDGDKSNNKYTNLEWCNRSYNIQHSFESGLRPVIWDTHSIREEALKYQTRLQFFKQSNSAYSAASLKGILNEVCSHMKCDRKTVKVQRSDGVVFDSVKDANKSIGATKGGLIARAIKRNIKAGGYYWKYV